jgi:hypothetical protein
MILSLIGFVDPAAGVSTVATFAAGLKRGDPQAISAGFALLADNAGGPAAAKDLAARLREGDYLTFSEWLARQPASSEDLAIGRIEAR